jgi:hypothetical protein
MILKRDIYSLRTAVGLGMQKMFNIMVCSGDKIADKIASKVFAYHVQRVSAKHGVKDDFAFLWEHAIFRHPPNKNPLTDRSEILHN